MAPEAALAAALEHPSQQEAQAAVKQAAGGKFLSLRELIERAENGSAEVAAVAQAARNKVNHCPEHLIHFAPK